MTTIHELQQIMWVETVHGIGQVLFILDYGPHENTVFMVANKEDGKIRHYVSNDVTLCKNYTFGFNLKSPNHP